MTPFVPQMFGSMIVWIEGYTLWRSIRFCRICASDYCKDDPLPITTVPTKIRYGITMKTSNKVVIRTKFPPLLFWQDSMQSHWIINLARNQLCHVNGVEALYVRLLPHWRVRGILPLLGEIVSVCCAPQNVLVVWYGSGEYCEGVLTRVLWIREVYIHRGY